MKFRVRAELSRWPTSGKIAGIFLIVFLLCAYLAAEAKVADLRPQSVSFVGVDSIKIAGDLYLPGNRQVGVVKKYPLVILLHMMGHDRTTYDPLVKALFARAPDFVVLAIDLPGHGESRTRVDGQNMDFRRFTQNDWAQCIDDINKVIWDMQNLPGAEAKQIDSQRIVIVGASVGANLALAVGARNKRVQAVVMLSPGMGFVSGPADATLREFNRPVLLVAGNDDVFSRDACKILSQASAKAKLRLFDRAGHGTDMFLPHPELINEIVVWLKGQLAIR
jgi:pimeloyl-ACP methyl ester carboxylesterase